MLVGCTGRTLKLHIHRYPLGLEESCFLIGEGEVTLGFKPAVNWVSASHFRYAKQVEKRLLYG
jgi:hypothetical protein